MRQLKSLFILVFLVSLLIFMEGSGAGTQEKLSVFEGKVLGIRMRLWLDVESQADKTVMNFRIGRRTVYSPHRYPNPGEIVKVEYQVQRGVPSAFTVTVLGEKKDAPEEETKEDPTERPKEREKEDSK